MSDFSNEEYKRAQIEWALVNLVKELRMLSHKGAMPTYYNSIKLARQVIPEVFDDNSFFVKRHHEPELVRSFRQQAEAESKVQQKEITPLDLVDSRISVLEKMLATEIEQKDLLNKELNRLRSIRPLFQKQSVSEDFVLASDVKSMKNGLQPINIGVKHTDYKVSENRALRVRLIHPTEGEQSMGADLIYEQYDTDTKKVRFIMIQYKIWDGELLYWSQAKNIQPQLDKLKNNLCDNHYCLSCDGKNGTEEFRYPYCTAFLRPTDRLQYKDSPLTSSGMHIPVCKIAETVEQTNQGNQVLRKQSMREKSISQKVFEECFNYNQLGSRWLEYEDAEKLYEEHGILSGGERIILHAQELEL